MMEIERSKVERLRELHGEILGGMKKTIAQAIEAGGILSEIKEALPHGDFTSWVEKNAGFDIRTAQRYMKTFSRREEIEGDTVSHLTEAYRLLEDKRESVRVSLDDLILKKKAALRRAQEAAEEMFNLEVEIGRHSMALVEVEDLLPKLDSLFERSTTTADWLDEVIAISEKLNECWKVLIPGWEDSWKEYIQQFDGVSPEEHLNVLRKIRDGLND